MLISDETTEKVNLIIQKMFDLNRTMDRFLAFSSTEWSFQNFNKVFHAGYAHLFPIAADFATDILLRYNVPAKYYETHSDTRIYTTMLDFFQTNLEENEEAYQIINNAIDSAISHKEYNVEADLKHFLTIWNRFMEQAILLRDKAQAYGEDNKQLFDAFCDQFYVLDGILDQLNGSND